MLTVIFEDEKLHNRSMAILLNLVDNRWRLIDRSDLAGSFLFSDWLTVVPISNHGAQKHNGNT